MNDYSEILSLISKIHSLSASYLREQLKEQGFPVSFSTSHGNILYRLSLKKRMTMSEITECIHRDKSTTTVLINKLVKEGFIKRIPSEEDNRVTFIELTDKGNSYNNATKQISDGLIKKCNETFSENELEQLLGLLSKVCENFQKKD